MMTIAVQEIDVRSLNLAIRMGLEVTRQEPRNLVINAGRGVALKTKELTPFVQMQTIDTELQVISTPKLVTRGPRKGLPLKSGETNLEVPDESLAMKIVLARMWPGSNYNRLTRQRWAIDRMAFSPGQGVAGFWAQVKETAERMVRSRHSSTHFLQAGWVIVYRKLTQLRYFTPALVAESVIDVESEVMADGVQREQSRLGEVVLSENGSTASLLLENMVGMEGVNRESYNQALHQYGAAAAQEGVNQQAAEMQARSLPRLEAKLAEKWDAIE